MNRPNSFAVVLLTVSAVLVGTLAPALAKPKARKAQRRAVATPRGAAVQQRRAVVTPRGAVVRQKRGAVRTRSGTVAVKKRGKVAVKHGRRRGVRVYPRYFGPRRAFVVGTGIWLGFRLAAAPYYYDYPVFERYPVEVAVQVELQRAGYYRGPIDGIVGKGTRRAIAEFQADNGMRPTGQIDRELIRELDLD